MEPTEGNLKGLIGIGWVRRGRWVKRLAMLEDLAPQVGLEPTTLRLTAECSAIELLRSAWRWIVLINVSRGREVRQKAGPACLRFAAA